MLTKTFIIKSVETTYVYESYKCKERKLTKNDQAFFFFS